MPKKQQSERLRYGDVVLFYSDEVKGYIEGAIEGAQAKLSLASLAAFDVGEVTNDQTASRRSKAEQARTDAARRRSSVVGEGKSKTLQPSGLRDCLFVFEPKQVRVCVYMLHWPLLDAFNSTNSRSHHIHRHAPVSALICTSAPCSLEWQMYHQQSKQPPVAKAAEDQEQESNRQKTNKVRTARTCIYSRHSIISLTPHSNCGRL